MEMTSLLQLFQGSVASAGLGSNPFTGTKQGLADDAQFANLLDLVSDMELADSQDPKASDFVANEADLLEDSALRPIKQQSQEANINLFLNEMVTQGKESVGQQLTFGHVETALPEERVAISKDLLSLQTQGSEKVLLDRFLGEQVAQVSSKPSAESVAEWAHALSRGDIKKVQVELSAKTGMEPMVKENQAAVAAAPIFTKQNQAVEVTASPMLSKEATKLTEPILVDKKIVDVKAEAAPDYKFEVSSKNPQAENKESVVFDKKSQEKKVFDSSEFLLDNSIDQQVSSPELRASMSASAAGFKHASVVTSAEFLGDSADSRIEPQTLQFVADKISSLKEAGGGRLVVNLDSESMGGVEIRVGIRAGQVHVQLTAERADTLKVLESSRNDLVSRLATIKEPVLEIGENRFLAKSTFEKVDLANPNLRTASSDLASAAPAFAKGVESVPLSQDFLRTGTVSSATFDSRMGLEVASASSRGFSSSEGANLSSNSGGFEGALDQRTPKFSEERQGDSRERAFDQWEKVFEDKKSA